MSSEDDERVDAQATFPTAFDNDGDCLRVPKVIESSEAINDAGVKVDMLRALARQRNMPVRRSGCDRNDKKDQLVEALMAYDDRIAVYDEIGVGYGGAMDQTAGKPTRRSANCYYRLHSVMLCEATAIWLMEINATPTRHDLDRGHVQGIRISCQ